MRAPPPRWTMYTSAINGSLCSRPPPATCTSSTTIALAPLSWPQTAAQRVVWSSVHDPFGSTTATVADIKQNLRLPGQKFEPETGWNHNGFRDYAPTLGRYLESDPIGLQGGSNAYAYALD